MSVGKKEANRDTSRVESFLPVERENLVGWSNPWLIHALWWEGWNSAPETFVLSEWINYEGISLVVSLKGPGWPQLMQVSRIGQQGTQQHTMLSNGIVFSRDIDISPEEIDRWLKLRSAARLLKKEGPLCSELKELKVDPDVTSLLGLNVFEFLGRAGITKRSDILSISVEEWTKLSECLQLVGAKRFLDLLLEHKLMLAHKTQSEWLGLKKDQQLDT